MATARRPWPGSGPATAAVALLAVAVAALSFWRMQALDESPESPTRGAAVYREHCAECHGRNREGQPGWDRLDPQTGRLPAPPLDHTGHAWMHSDADLVRMIEESAPLDPPDGYVSGMPAFRGTLPEEDVKAAVALIKSGWPAGVRAYQAMLNPDRAGMPAGDVDWTFPPNCGAEPIRSAGASR